MLQFLVTNAMRLSGINAQPLAALLLVGFKVAFAPMDVAVSLERQDVRGNTVQEPPIVRDHYRAAGKIHNRLFQCPQGIHVQIIRGFIQ